MWNLVTRKQGSLAWLVGGPCGDGITNACFSVGAEPSWPEGAAGALLTTV